LVLTGEKYEYLFLDDRLIGDFDRLLGLIPNRDKVKYVDFNLLKFDNDDNARRMFDNLNNRLGALMYFSL